MPTSNSSGSTATTGAVVARARTQLACTTGCVVLAWVLTAPGAAAHIERTSYWPDAQADRSLTPAAGGAVPVARSLNSALQAGPAGETRVVCKPDSLARALDSIGRAQAKGYRLRPSQPLLTLTPGQARGLRQLNRELFERCAFRDIQAAVFKSTNNDRVVVMPGRYRENPSRAQPTNDPRCADLRETNALGRAGAASYRYQVACPNDQSLIYIQGRTVPAKAPPNPPLASRFGIPDADACLRCNLQIEGAGVTPLDVVIDAARDPKASLRSRAEAAKDVVIRADRADGIVIRNLTTTHAREHGIYIHETDGYLLDDFKSLYNDLYGALLFTSDHGLTSDCELSGHRDAGVYPGGAPDTGTQRQEARARLNQTITRCDLHHNAAGYSANMGNAVRVHANNIYDNTTGVLNVSLFPAGHPGYPQDSATFEKNAIYSNNLNGYAPGSDVVPAVPLPIGVGILILGGNDNVIRGNRIWDNWRRGTMQVSVPDVVANPPGDPNAHSTSHRNRYYDNVLGVARDGTRAPNGLDFWWDEADGDSGNCWYANGSFTSDPATLPATCDSTSTGTSYPAHLRELLPCLGAFNTGSRDPNACPWFRMPPPPPNTPPRAANMTRAGADANPPARGMPFATSERLQVATCQDWQAARLPDRLDAVTKIQAIIAGPRHEGLTLPHDHGYDAVNQSCQGTPARGFLLFELYSRAVAFAGRPGI